MVGVRECNLKHGGQDEGQREKNKGQGHQGNK